jgi:hypothetical protein
MGWGRDDMVWMEAAWMRVLIDPSVELLAFWSIFLALPFSEYYIKDSYLIRSSLYYMSFSRELLRLSRIGAICRAEG